MIWVAALAVLAAAVGLGLAALFAYQLRAEQRAGEEVRSLAVYWESRCHAAEAAGGLARSELANARQALEDGRRAWQVDRGDYESRLRALREALEAERGKRGPGFR